MSFNYYTSLPDFVSNSQLGELQKMLRCIAPMEGLQFIYDFGNLVDCLKTEPHKFNALTNTWTDDGGRSVTFDSTTVNQAFDMVDALNNDPVLSKAMQGGLFQYVFTRKRHRFEYDGEVFYLPIRLKADIYVRRTLLIDIKTTGCTTLAQFIASITYFDYDRQACFYLDGGEVDRILYVGVSKVKNKRCKHEIFKFLIERGDEMYLSGLRKKSYLGWKYYNLIHSLQIKPQIIKL